MLETVCRDAGVPLYRTSVGEAHVVARMREVGAIAGGEGNGGMILPEAHFGRDALVATALVADAMAAGGRTLRELADQLPASHMVKAKLERGDEPWDRAAERLRKAFASHDVNGDDGLRFSRGDEWVHVRPSGTEPVVRVIAESPQLERTRELIETAQRALTAQRAEV
jgi:phosphomannomutase